MTRKLERSPLYGVDCHESMGAPLNDHFLQEIGLRLIFCYFCWFSRWRQAYR